MIGWRSVEIAVTNLVVAGGGTNADAQAAVARIGETPAAVAVAELPAGTAPADLAAAARAAADAVLAAAPAADPAAIGEG